MTTGYIVVEVEYQYNDEYYYTDSRGGNPVKVFLKKEDAEKFCRQKNVEAFSKRDVGGYIMDGDWTTIFDDPEAMASKYALNLDEPWNIALPTDPAKLAQFADDCNLEFYRILQVEID